MSNNKQQTAVEWYIDQHKILAKLSDTISNSEILNRISDIEKQAKEMEREQIKEAYFIGGHQMKNNKYIGMHDYYNETYGGNK
jgi:hypothetical protein